MIFGDQVFSSSNRKYDLHENLGIGVSHCERFFTNVVDNEVDLNGFMAGFSPVSGFILWV